MASGPPTPPLSSVLLGHLLLLPAPPHAVALLGLEPSCPLLCRWISPPPLEGRAGFWRAGSPAHSSLGLHSPAHGRRSGGDCKWVLVGLREHEGSPGRWGGHSHTLQATWPSICLSVSWSIKGVMGSFTELLGGLNTG